MKEQYLATFQTNRDIKYRYTTRQNASDTHRRYFDTLEEAQMALKHAIRVRNRGARVEISQCGSFGVDIVVDEESAYDFGIANTKIQKRFVSEWEDVEGGDNYGICK